MKNSVIAAALDKAPPHIREELESLKGHIHSKEQFESISMEARAWLLQQAVDSPDAMTKLIEEKYRDLANILNTAEDGLVAMKRVMPEEKADVINLELYNACAKFVRAYNSWRLSK